MSESEVSKKLTRRDAIKKGIRLSRDFFLGGAILAYTANSIYYTDIFQSYLDSLDPKKLKNGTEFFKDLKAYLSENYEIDISVGLDRKVFKNTTVTESLSDFSMEKLAVFAKETVESLAKYPTNLFKVMKEFGHEVEIIITHQPKEKSYKRFVGRTMQHPKNPKRIVLLVDIDQINTEPDKYNSYEVEGTTHHELFHWFFITMKEEIRDEIEAEWEKILEDAKKELSADALKLTFYNSYGETEWGEDMATFAEYMMHRGRYQMLTNLCEGRIEDAYRDRNSIRYDAPKKIKTMENIRKAAPFIKRKVELMKKAFKISTMGIMGENFWQDFLRIHQTRP